MVKKQKVKKKVEKKRPSFLARTVKIRVSNLLLLGMVLVALFLLNSLILAKKEREMKKNLLPQAIKKIINNNKTKFTIEKFKRTSGLYQFELKINGRKYVSYLSKDAKILFTSGIKLDNLLKKPKNKSATTANKKKVTAKNIDKSSQPKLVAFIMSNCPFGLQMQRAFKKALQEQPALKPLLSIKYIGTINKGKINSLHGDKEAQEDLKQVCIREEQSTKYWPYVSCYMEKGQTAPCLQKNGIDENKLDSCLKDKKRGLAYLQKDFTEAKKNNIESSPTLLLNKKQKVSEFNFGGRTPEAIKSLVCASFKKKPAFCKKKLSQDPIAASFSTKETTKKTGGSQPAAQCGN